MSSHHTLSAGLPHGQRRKGNTASVSYSIYVKVSEGTEQAGCSEEVQLFLIRRSEGSFSHGSLEIRRRMIGAMVWLLSLQAFALASHWNSSLSWLSAVKELLAKCYVLVKD